MVKVSQHPRVLEQSNKVLTRHMPKHEVASCTICCTAILVICQLADLSLSDDAQTVHEAKAYASVL